MCSTKSRDFPSCANCAFDEYPPPDECNTCWVDEDQFPSNWFPRESMRGKAIELRAALREFWKTFIKSLLRR